MVAIFYLAVCLMAFGFAMAVLVFVFSLLEKAAVAKRAAEILNPTFKATGPPIKKSTQWMLKFSDFFGRLRKRMGVSDNKKIVGRMAMAGIHDSRALDIFFGLRLTLPIASLVVAAFLTDNPAIIIGALGIGYLVPDIALERISKRRLLVINRSIPDTVDLLVICMNAGLGIDQAIQRTADTLHIVYPELSYELIESVRLQNLGISRAQAWKQMVDRTKSTQIGQLSNIFSQAESFGTPIVDAMRAFADSLRIKRRQNAEERAARKGIQMLIPLAFFIFPAIMIILMGPAMLSIIQGFKYIGH